MSNNQSESHLLTSVLNFKFLRPVDLTLQGETSQHARYCFQSEQSKRSSRCMMFSIDGKINQNANHTALQLTQGESFQYVSRESTVGSIGTEYEISGHLTIDGQTLFIKAFANAGAGFNDASWALPIIQTVKR